MFFPNNNMSTFLNMLKDGAQPIRNPADVFIRDEAAEMGFVRTFMCANPEEVRREENKTIYLGDSRYVWAELTELGREYIEDFSS